jgi:FG-GAP-like repeat
MLQEKVTLISHKDLISQAVEKGPVWEDKRCHRSANAGPAQAALEIERSDPHTSVTFLSYACSGASITEGLVGWYDGVEPPSNPVLYEFQQFILQTGTALHPTDQTFDFAVARWNNDTIPDLIAIKKNNTGTQSTEVHILNGTTGFQQFILQTGTALHPTDQTFDFAVADWDNNTRPDLIAIKKNNTGTQSTEVHIVS